MLFENEILKFYLSGLLKFLSKNSFIATYGRGEVRSIEDVTAKFDSKFVQQPLTESLNLTAPEKDIPESEHAAVFDGFSHVDPLVLASYGMFNRVQENTVHGHNSTSSGDHQMLGRSHNPRELASSIVEQCAKSLTGHNAIKYQNQMSLQQSFTNSLIPNSTSRNIANISKINRNQPVSDMSASSNQAQIQYHHHSNQAQNHSLQYNQNKNINHSVNPVSQVSQINPGSQVNPVNQVNHHLNNLNLNSMSINHQHQQQIPISQASVLSPNSNLQLHFNNDNQNYPFSNPAMHQQPNFPTQLQQQHPSISQIHQAQYAQLLPHSQHLPPQSAQHLQHLGGQPSLLLTSPNHQNPLSYNNFPTNNLNNVSSNQIPNLTSNFSNHQATNNNIFANLNNNNNNNNNENLDNQRRQFE